MATLCTYRTRTRDWLSSTRISRAEQGLAGLKQPVRETVSYRGLFTAGWFGVREKQCSRLKIYDRLRANEQAANQHQEPAGRSPQQYSKQSLITVFIP